jgi:hypothetical protein
MAASSGDEQPGHRLCVVVRCDRWQGPIKVLPGEDGLAPWSHAVDRTPGCGALTCLLLSPGEAVPGS